MGYQDRDYYQDGGAPSGFRLGGDLSYTWRLVIVNVGLFLANFLFFAGSKSNLTTLLALHGDTLIHPQYWWQFLTYGFVHDSTDLGHLGWNMVGLVIFGSAVEAAYGRREYLRFYLIAILLGGIVWGARVYLAATNGMELLTPMAGKEAMLVGASGGITAVTLLFCLRYPFAQINLMLLVPVPAWVVGVIVVVGDILQVRQQGNTAHDVHLVGAAFAVAYFYSGWNLTRTFSFSWLRRLGTIMEGVTKMRPKLKVYDQADDEDEDDDAAYHELETEADRILEKISQDGEGSLSKKERQTLERYSRLMRQKHR